MAKYDPNGACAWAVPVGRGGGNSGERLAIDVDPSHRGVVVTGYFPGAQSFGTGPLGSDTIELTRAGTVVVAATRFDRLAEIHIDDVRTPPDTPVRLAVRNGTVAPPAAALQSMPGFEYVIAPLDA